MSHIGPCSPLGIFQPLYFLKAYCENIGVEISLGGSRVLRGSRSIRYNFLKHRLTILKKNRTSFNEYVTKSTATLYCIYILCNPQFLNTLKHISNNIAIVFGEMCLREFFPTLDACLMVELQ